MGRYFGTDGFRGKANETLTAEHAFAVGRFIGWFYGREHKCRVVIGKDTRRSSYMFEYALTAGLTAAGADAYLMHVTSTPSVSYIVRTEQFDCGIMLSASHNPYYDNGIKLFNGKGEKMDEEVIALIEDFIDGKLEGVEIADSEEIGRAYDFSAGRNRYVGHLISLVTCSFKGKKVGLDCANGASFSIAKSVFDALGAETYVINSDPDGFNINRDCGSTHIEGLQAFVKEKGLDLGFAFDGDADRCLCVDHTGQIVDGDKILYVLGMYLKGRESLKDDCVVTTVMSNIGLYKAFAAAGLQSVKTAVGDKYVYEEMQKNGYMLGGEQSGHIILSQYETTGDGILTALKLMEVVVNEKKSLKELADPVIIYPQLLKNIRVTDKDAAQKNSVVLAEIARLEEELGDDGRMLVRASGTEPLLRVMAEADTKERCRYCVDAVIAKLAEQGLIEN